MGKKYIKGSKVDLNTFFFLPQFLRNSVNDQPPKNSSSPPPRVCLPGMGLQARIKPRLQADPAVALHPGAPEEGRVPRRHRLAGRLWRVCHQGPRRGGSPMGGQEVQTTDELRQAQPSTKVGLKWVNKG